LAKGGAQAYFGVQADLVTYGKTLGGGYPVGVVCGRADLMKRFRSERPADICFARGTFNAHPHVMGAMSVFLEKIETAFFKYFSKTGREKNSNTYFFKYFRKIYLGKNYLKIFSFLNIYKMSSRQSLAKLQSQLKASVNKKLGTTYKTITQFKTHFGLNSNDATWEYLDEFDRKKKVKNQIPIIKIKKKKQTFLIHLVFLNRKFLPL
jgi:hypothetical protein